jgi:hypothetical protein
MTYAMMPSKSAVKKVLGRVFLQGDRPIRLGREAIAMFLTIIALYAIIGALNRWLRDWLWAGLSVAFAVPLTLVFVASRWDQKRRIENRCGSGKELGRERR